MQTDNGSVALSRIRELGRVSPRVKVHINIIYVRVPRPIRLAQTRRLANCNSTVPKGCATLCRLPPHAARRPELRGDTVTGASYAVRTNWICEFILLKYCIAT